MARNAAKRLLLSARRVTLWALRAWFLMRRRRPPRRGPGERLQVRVLLLHAYGMGGTIRTTLTMAELLAAEHDVEVISVRRDRKRPFFPFPEGVRVTVLDDHERPRGRVCRLLSRLPSLLTPREDASFRRVSLWTDLRLMSRLMTLDCDVLMATRPSLNILIAEAAPRGTRTIAQDHMNLGSYRPKLRAAIVRAYRRLDVVTVLTEVSLADYRAALIDAPVEVVRIPNALARPVAGLGGTAAPPANVVLAAGRLTRQKGFDLLIQAYEQVAAGRPDWTLRIFGSGAKRDELRRMIGDRGLGGRVELRGRTADLAGEMAGAAVYALPSRYEGLPMVVIEAMGTGLPVVAFDCPTGPGEMITHGYDGLLVPAGDVAGFAAALRELIEDADLRHRMGERALVTARAYAPAVISARWNDLVAGP